MNEKEIIWITGAGSGIGSSLALKFTAEGYNVAASSRNNEALQNLKENNKGPGELIIFPLDVRESGDVMNTASAISDKYVIRGLINNAGITRFKDAAQTSIEEADDIIKTNLLGSIYAINAVLPQMSGSVGGTILNIISVTAQKIFTKSSVYSASKSGLLAYANVLREEVRKDNIRVINVSPGATRTGIWPEPALEKFAERMLDPEDVADAIINLYKMGPSVVAEDITLRPQGGDL